MTVPISVKEEAADHGIPAAKISEAHLDIATELEAEITASAETGLYT